MERIRLDKYLCDMGQGTRSQVKEAARKGRVWVNGVAQHRPEHKICPGLDEVSLDGKLVTYAHYEYYMLNKPKGVVSARSDPFRQTVLDLVPEGKREDLFPVGRLDLDTEGLLLLTNDGDLAHQLLSPKKHVYKVYQVEVEGSLPLDGVQKFAEGIRLADGTQTLPAALQVLCKSDAGASLRLAIREGKFHQVKRMLEAVGCHVVYLKRIAMGSLSLDPELAPGQCRPLTEEEIEALKASHKKKGKQVQCNVGTNKSHNI